MPHSFFFFAVFSIESSYAQTNGPVTGSDLTEDSKGAETAAESGLQIIRDVNGSGGIRMVGNQFGLHGTVSQTAINRLRRPNANDDRHYVGFWYWAKQARSFACVRFPMAAAEPGTEITIPLLIEQVERLPVSAALRFQARIRFNRSLLQPVDGTPACTFDGDDCLIDIDVPVTAQSIETGVLAELRFLAKLGNAESTPLVIESFAWVGFGEQPIETVTKPGEFVLLGICREGGHIRLIHSAGPASRVRVWPNPVTHDGNVEFTSREAGTVRLTLVDAIGREVATVAEQEAEAGKLYRMGLDFSSISSGSYLLVFDTPTEVKTIKLTVQQ